ncbi:MAG TPA: nitrogenase component 1 [Polyangia bacterium]
MSPLTSTLRFNYAYSTGVVLAVNAVRDAFLVLDAPACALWRPGFIQGHHDSTSTLWDAEGGHRFQITDTSTERIISGNLPGLAQQLQRISRAPGCGAILAAGFPMALISGTPYEAIWGSLTPAPSVPFFPVTGGSVSSDWLDGYAQTILALAKAVALPAATRRPEDVAIVGYMFDRGERDHVANLAELRRMLAGIGLNLVSVWPSGVAIAGLGAAASAGTILSFPYARDAAATLAGRLAAALVECDLPLGLRQSADWIRRVGRAVGREAEADAFAEQELARLVPRLEWAVEEIFLHATVIFAGDPVMVRPVARQIADVGGRMVAAAAMGAPHHAHELGSWADLPFPVYEAPSVSTMFRAEPEVDCIIGAGDCGRRQRTVELGFPSYRSHAFHDRPYLGFEGALCLLGRVAENLQWKSEGPGTSPAGDDHGGRA